MNDYEIKMDVYGVIQKIRMGHYVDIEFNDKTKKQDIVMFLPRDDAMILNKKGNVYVQIKAESTVEATKRAFTLFKYYVNNRWIPKPRRKSKSVPARKKKKEKKKDSLASRMKDRLQ